MNTALATLSSPRLTFLPLKSPSSSSSSASFLGFPSPKPLRLRACSAKLDSVPVSETNSKNRPLAQKLQSFAKTAVLVGATALMVGKFSNFPAKADPAPAMVEQEPAFREEKEEAGKTQDAKQKQTSPLSEFLESNEEAFEALKSLLYQKLENHEDEEALSILNRLVSAQPEVTDWKFLLARLLGDMGQKENARKVFEEILQSNPFSFEALFENALLMDRCGEGEAVLKRLEEALSLAQEEKKDKEARDVRFIIAQIQFLQNNVEGAFMTYQELAKEDPSDYRPYFCQGMIYTLLDRNDEAKEQFAKYKKLSPRKHQVEGYLRTPLSKMKLFDTNEEN
ncbi:protein SLOW GREEN 1 [Hibiscus syriacus]|uniref:Protein SLOW GREEN 1 n=1 Tax=Hibiscus syriacus TaxID=106335 RepID=A0A6A3B055_HIBSY|nr:protein SLOW GREEN 1, chloroplastic-like [Hibiscus syriacus]KAE8710106.1 protein SLOW GREEN 1 [Hibiscus syriacus]